MVKTHKESIEKADISTLLEIIGKSKSIYVRENISVKLHESQIRLLKNVKSHQRPNHAKIRIEKYKNAEKTLSFKAHEEIYLKKYKILEDKGLVKVNEAPENGLAYDVSLNEKGQEVLTEICVLEKMWADNIQISDSEKEIIKNIALNSYNIIAEHKNKFDFNF